MLYLPSALSYILFSPFLTNFVTTCILEFRYTLVSTSAPQSPCLRLIFLMPSSSCLFLSHFQPALYVLHFCSMSCCIFIFLFKSTLFSSFHAEGVSTSMSTKNTLFVLSSYSHVLSCVLLYSLKRKKYREYKEYIRKYKEYKEYIREYKEHIICRRAIRLFK